MKQIKSYVNVFTKTFSYLIPKKKDRWVFGAWYGKGYMDNSKYLLEYISKNYPEKELIWIQNCKERPRELPPNVKFVKYGTRECLKIVLTAELSAVSQGFADLYPYALQGGSYMIQLWHGVAWKKIGRDSLVKTKNPFRKMMRDLTEWYSHASLYIAPSKEYAKKMGPAMGAKSNEILLAGQPRNEIFFDETRVSLCRKNILHRFNMEETVKIIVYMPTFRDNLSEVRSMKDVAEEKVFKEYMKNNKVLILQKGHFISEQRNNTMQTKEFVYNVVDVDAQELLAAADVLITDYSSCSFDYLLLNRPIIYYLYDYHYYAEKDRGLYYRPEQVAAGEIGYNPQEVAEALIRALNNPDKGNLIRKKVKEEFCTFETIDNSKNICQRALLDLNKGRD